MFSYSEQEEVWASHAEVEKTREACAALEANARDREMLPPATRSELFCPFQLSIDFP